MRAVGLSLSEVAGFILQGRAKSEHPARRDKHDMLGTTRTLSQSGVAWSN
jgi:hypothetical protein